VQDRKWGHDDVPIWTNQRAQDWVWVAIDTGLGLGAEADRVSHEHRVEEYSTARSRKLVQSVAASTISRKVIDSLVANWKETFAREFEGKQGVEGSIQGKVCILVRSARNYVQRVSKFQTKPGWHRRNQTGQRLEDSRSKAGDWRDHWQVWTEWVEKCVAAGDGLINRDSLSENKGRAKVDRWALDAVKWGSPAIGGLNQRSSKVVRQPQDCFHWKGSPYEPI
jgi:hypothetical protein